MDLEVFVTPGPGGQQLPAALRRRGGAGRPAARRRALLSAASPLLGSADLPVHPVRLPRTEPVWVICPNRHRAAVAASLLDREGIPQRLVGNGGVGEWCVGCRPVAA